MARPAAQPSARPSADSPGVHLPPPLVFVAAFLVGVALEWAVPLPGPPAPWGLTAGLLGIAAFLALNPPSVLLFRRAETSVVPFRPAAALVTSGPYRLTRNPMYLGFVFLYLGLALWLGVLWALVLLPVAVAVVDRMVIAPEERYLERAFGEEYRRYRARVRRWL